MPSPCARAISAGVNPCARAISAGVTRARAISAGVTRARATSAGVKPMCARSWLVSNPCARDLRRCKPVCARDLRWCQTRARALSADRGGLLGAADRAARARLDDATGVRRVCAGRQAAGSPGAPTRGAAADAARGLHDVVLFQWLDAPVPVGRARERARARAGPAVVLPARRVPVLLPFISFEVSSSSFFQQSCFPLGECRFFFLSFLLMFLLLLFQQSCFPLGECRSAHTSPHLWRRVHRGPPASRRATTAGSLDALAGEPVCSSLPTATVTS